MTHHPRSRLGAVARRLAVAATALAAGVSMTMLGATDAIAAPKITLASAGSCKVRVTVSGVTTPTNAWIASDYEPIRISGDGTYVLPILYSTGVDPTPVALYSSSDPFGWDATTVLAESAVQLAACENFPAEPLLFTPLPPVPTRSITLEPGTRCGTVKARITGTSTLPLGQLAFALVYRTRVEVTGITYVEDDGIYVVDVAPGVTQVVGGELVVEDESNPESSEVIASTTATVAVTPCPAPLPQVPALGYTATGAFGNHTGDRLADVYAVKPNGNVDLFLGQPKSVTRLDYGTLAAPKLVGATKVVQIGDTNGDKRSDLLVRAADNNLYIYTTTATGTLVKGRQVGANWAVMDQIIYAGTLKGGTTQYVVGRRSDNGDLYRYTLTATGLTGTTKIGHGWQAIAHFVSVGDFNGDGRSDIVGVRHDGTLWVYQGTTAATLAPGRQVGHGWSGFTQIFSPGDISGDGRFDLLGVDSTGKLRGYHNGGNGWWSTSVTLGTGFGQYTLMA